MKILTLEITPEVLSGAYILYHDKHFGRKSIALDLDGVVWNLHQLLLKFYNEQYKTNYTYEDITKWDFFPTDRFYKIYNKLYNYMVLFQKIDPNLKKYMQLLYKFFNITILTQGNYTIELIADKLETWGIRMGECYDSILIIDVEESKVDYSFDYFIDDNPNLVEEIMKYPDKELLLFDQPWNKKTFPQFNSWRVKSWKEIKEYLIPSGRNLDFEEM